MKEIMCIIRMNRVNSTKTALATAGFTSSTFIKVLGRGVKSIDQTMAEAFKSRGEKVPAPYGENDSEKGRLVPKRLVSIIVNDGDVEDVVEIIMKTNYTGAPGDGKIFVMPSEEVYRVRDGASGNVTI